MQNDGQIEDGGAVALGEAERPASADEAVWHAGWAIGMAAGGALLLLLIGGVSHQALWALALIAAPGAIGALWLPKMHTAFGLLALWTVGATAAVMVSGGISGPLTVFCAAPIIASLAIGASWGLGVGLSLAAAVVCTLLGLTHWAPPAPAEPVRTVLTLIALAMTVGAVGGAILIVHRRSEAEREHLQSELETFQGLMGDLPELALAMDAEGRTEAVFGQPLQGLALGDLHGGLVAVAAPVDRPGVEAAMGEALQDGASLVVFTLDVAEGEGGRIAASLQRTSAGGLTAILRPAPTRTVQPPVSEPSPEVERRLTDAEAARREAEQGRDKAEADASARTRFLANMSHELRTPLNAIMGFSDMMRTRVFGELPPKYAEYAELIHESGGHLLELINDVLDMSKIEAQRYTLVTETFDVREPLAAALRLMQLQADEAGVKLRGALPVGAPLTVHADRRAIKQIALNLLSNAVKFTPRDGTVILTAQVAAGALEMIVADTGMGIAEEDLKRIGQPFEQAGDVSQRALGTGLGLALVEAFAKLHGGTLTLESRLGEGTAATVRLPVLAAAEPPPIEAAPAEAAPIETAAEPLASEVEPPEPEKKAFETSVFVEPALATAEPHEPAPEAATIHAARVLEAEDVAALQSPTSPEAHPPEPESAPEIVAESAPAPLPEPESIAPQPIELAPPAAHVVAAEPVAFAPASHAGVNGAKPVLNGLGPLDARAIEHQGLRQSVLSIFRSLGVHPETGEPLPEPPNDPPRPGNGGIRVQG